MDFSSDYFQLGTTVEQGWQWAGNKAGSGLGTIKAGSGLGTRLAVGWEQGWQWTENKAGSGLGTRLAVDWEKGWQ